MLPGRVDTLTFRGAHTSVLLDCSGLRLEAEVANVAGASPAWLCEGADVTVHVSPNALARARERRLSGAAAGVVAAPAPASPVEEAVEQPVGPEST